MSLRIQNNVEAFNAHRQLTATSDKLARSMEKLSSGYRINRAADDSAVCTSEMASCAFRCAWSTPPIWASSLTLMARPAESSAARLIR